MIEKRRGFDYGLILANIYMLIKWVQLLHIVLIIKKNTIYCVPVVDMKNLGWHSNYKIVLLSPAKMCDLLVSQQLQKQHLLPLVLLL